MTGTWTVRVDTLLERPVATRSIALVRIVVGLVAFVHLGPIAVDGLRGETYHDRFHDPFFDRWWRVVAELPPAWFTAVICLGALAALAMAAGMLTRWSTATVAIVVGYHLALSTTHLHNNRAYLFAILLGLALAPCGRSWSVDRWWQLRRGREAAPERMAAWPLWLLRFESSLVYAASGFSKLVDPDWFGGTVTHGRVITQESMLRESVLPDGLQDLLLERSFHTIAAPTVVLTELLIAAGLWWRPSRRWAIAVAVVFHVAIELSASVQTFSYLAIGVLIVWADPALPVRRPLARRVTA